MDAPPSEPAPTRADPPAAGHDAAASLRPIDRKAAIRAYKDTPRPAGLFGVRNRPEDRLYVGAAADLRAVLNRQRFQLDGGLHPDRELQADWRRLGAGAFSFEVLDELEPATDPAADRGDDLAALYDLWLERLAAQGQALYGDRRPTGHDRGSA
jgi:hypothetical protein